MKQRLIDLSQMAILNPSESGVERDACKVSIRTDTGSMWGQGNTCRDLLLFPEKGPWNTAEVSVELLPQFNGEQAGLLCYVDQDNYIKLVREMVDEKQVVVLAKEMAGEPSAELIEPYEGAKVDLRLTLMEDTLAASWRRPDDESYEEAQFQNWLAANREIQVGLFAHGFNPANQAVFQAFSMDAASS